MTCGSCGHDAPHGRRGFGACSQKTWTAHGRAEAERINAELTAERKSEVVIVRVLETLFALPGMHERCACKRQKPATALPPAAPPQGGTR
jgi:hypothetical protein